MDATKQPECSCIFQEHKAAFEKLLHLIPLLSQFLVQPNSAQHSARTQHSEIPGREERIDALVHNPTIDDLLTVKGESLITIAPKAFLAEAARMMNQNRIGLLLVREEGTQAVMGVLSERDLVRAIATISDPPFDQLTVDSLMTTNLVTCQPEDTLIYILDIMRMRKFRHMPVKRDGHITAIVSITDILSHLKTDAEINSEEFLWTKFMNNL